MRYRNRHHGDELEILQRQRTSHSLAASTSLTFESHLSQLEQSALKLSTRTTLLGSAALPWTIPSILCSTIQLETFTSIKCWMTRCKLSFTTNRCSLSKPIQSGLRHHKATQSYIVVHHWLIKMNVFNGQSRLSRISGLMSWGEPQISLLTTFQSRSSTLCLLRLSKHKVKRSISINLTSSFHHHFVLTIQSIRDIILFQAFNISQLVYNSKNSVQINQIWSLPRRNHQIEASFKFHRYQSCDHSLLPLAVLSNKVS